MDRFAMEILVVLMALIDGSSAKATTPPVGAWPQFRGVRAGGIAEGSAPPVKWEADGKSCIRWKTEIPGLGHGGPIIWGDRLYLTTAVSGKKDAKVLVGLYGDIASVPDDTVHQWKVFCLSKNTGRVLWEQTACEGVPKIKRHTKATHANCTPATDGRNVVAFFGSEGLYCYDMDGKLRWKKDLGVLDSGYYVVPDAQWEFGSSPIIEGGRVFVQCDVQKDPFIAAFDIEDGRELWRTDRDDVPTWSTPTYYESGGKQQLIVNGYKHIGGYDAKTGKELWRMRGGGDIPVPTPVVVNDLAIIVNAHGMLAPIFAVKLNSTGDISLGTDETSNDHVAWCDWRNGAYMQTPLVYNGYVYSARDNGVVTCYEVATGKQMYRERIGNGWTGFTASPVAAGGRIFFTSETGEVYPLKAGPTYKRPRKNVLNENCMATPAISEGTIYFRTEGHVVAVGRPAGKSDQSPTAKAH